MKFSEITDEQWDELQPYLDTCLLPVTGLKGNESPCEATSGLERLRDLMDMVEIPFKGRIVTYPACHYLSEGDTFAGMLDGWCSNLKASGFKYVIVISSDPSSALRVASADLVVQPDVAGTVPTAVEVSSQIREMWSSVSP